MRNRVLLLSMIISSLFITVVAPKSEAAPDADAILTRQMAVTLIRENSVAVRDAVHNEKKSLEDYESQMKKSAMIDTEKVFVYHNSYAEEDVYYYYEPTEQMQMRLMKEFLPERMKYVWEIRKTATKITENTMANTADNLFFGLYGAYRNTLSATEYLEVMQQSYQRELIRFKNGLITKLDLNGSELDLKEAENAYVKSERNFENLHRQFNMLAGLPLDYRYELIGTPWSGRNEISFTEEEAVADALTNRMEIWDLKRQILLAIRQMEIYRHKDVHKSHQATRENYQKSLEQLEELKLKLSVTEYDIEKEIRQAYKEVELGYLELEINKEKLIRQKNQLETMRKRYESGFITASVIKQMEQAVNQLESAINMGMVTALNKSNRLSRAISAGPGYYK